MSRNRRYDDDDDDFGGRWGYYPKTTPRAVKNGIKTKSQRGAIGATWWSQRWVQVLESFNIGARLQRGRSYARRGQVVSIDVAPGRVKALVQGSQPRPYTIDIRLATLSDDEWTRAAGVMASRAIFAAKLLAGEMPQDIETAFRDAQTSLFPTRHSDLKTECSCPDWSNPCKHIAAVYYILAEQFDEDPFLIFKLRGRRKEQIIAALRAQRVVHDAPAEYAAAEPEPVAAEPLPADHTFWLPGAELESFSLRFDQAPAESAALKQLGEAPYPIGGRMLSLALAEGCAVVARAAAQKAAR
jgi:uncharacterized Zn finger protein